MKYTATYLILLVFLMLFANVSRACTCAEPYMPIDSLAQLEEYDFIAHVKIIEDKDYEQDIDEKMSVGLLTIEILEQFKGVSMGEVYEMGKYSSCDMGIAVGEEWVLFGEGNEDEIWVSACDRDFIYRKSDGLRYGKSGYGINQLLQLRKLYNRPTKKYENKTIKEYYPNGQIEIREVYKNGELEGKRKLWYPSGDVYGIEYYKNGKKEGQSKWYYPNGQLRIREVYKNGEREGERKLWYPNGNVYRIEYYKNDERIRSQEYNDTDKPKND